MFLIRFWRNLTKKDSVESATVNMKEINKKNSTCSNSFWTVFFMVPDRIRIFGRSGLRKKKFDPDPEKKVRIRNTGVQYSTFRKTMVGLFEL